jgi:uncharacterized membrane protein
MHKICNPTPTLSVVLNSSGFLLRLCLLACKCTGYIKRNNIPKQAGLSRATLEISFDLSSNFILRTHSHNWYRDIPFSVFLRLSSIVGVLHFEDLKNMVWLFKLKLKI